MLARLLRLLSRSQTLPPVNAARPHAAGRPGAAHPSGNALLAQGRLDEAAAAFREPIAVDPLAAEPFVNLGYVLQ